MVSLLKSPRSVSFFNIFFRNQEKLLPWFLKTRLFEVLESWQSVNEKDRLVNLVTGWLEKPDCSAVMKVT